MKKILQEYTSKGRQHLKIFMWVLVASSLKKVLKNNQT